MKYLFGAKSTFKTSELSRVFVFLKVRVKGSQYLFTVLTAWMKGIVDRRSPRAGNLMLTIWKVAIFT